MAEAVAIAGTVVFFMGALIQFRTKARMKDEQKRRSASSRAGPRTQKQMIRSREGFRMEGWKEIKLWKIPVTMESADIDVIESL